MKELIKFEFPLLLNNKFVEFRTFKEGDNKIGILPSKLLLFGGTTGLLLLLLFDLFDFLLLDEGEFDAFIELVVVFVFSLLFNDKFVKFVFVFNNIPAGLLKSNGFDKKDMLLFKKLLLFTLLVFACDADGEAMLLF